MNDTFQSTVASEDVYGRSWYSSEMLHGNSKVASLSEAPGAKWATKKFSNNIHASVKSEAFVAMLEENTDRRPFAGAPFNPANTFATTQPGATATVIGPYTAAEEPPVAKPPPARRPLTLARLLASR